MLSKTLSHVKRPHFVSWQVLLKSMLWSTAIAGVGFLIGGILGLYQLGDHIPLLGLIANDTRVVSISGFLAVVATIGACQWFFEEAGVLIGFIILTSFGLLVICCAVTFGYHAFHMIRTGIAGALLLPLISFPITYFLVAKSRT
ncbi:MAG: hypothetical protein JNL67_21070 [Planctomycetaceae bacterium]|nr:hypothetical protein [Planctomycetaceae bacterium]